VDLRDIYENNANAAARRVRECIFAMLPPWFVEDAKERCKATNADGGGKPFAHRVSEALGRYAQLGVLTEQLERKLGRPNGEWTGDDLGTLTVIYRSVRSGETTLADEFPPERVTVAEITTKTAP